MAQSYSTAFILDESPEAVFGRITNVRSWWSGLYSEEIIGNTQHLNDEFSFRAGDGAHYSNQKMIECVPGKKVVWLVTEGNLSFVKKTDEWAGTKLIFEIIPQGDRTQLIFTHEGLTPQLECYDSCSTAWSQYLEQKLLPTFSQRNH